MPIHIVRINYHYVYKLLLQYQMFLLQLWDHFLRLLVNLLVECPQLCILINQILLFLVDCVL